MEELRLVRREERSLIVATEAGEEFSLVVDDTVLAELRHLSRKESSGARVRPREIQALIRAGKSRAEVMEVTGLSESDIERYEGPVIAERDFILQRAHVVPVRTAPGDSESEQFGEVISERLIGLGATDSSWSAWRDEETGWMVGLDFSSRDIEHRAIWSFDHRKGVLAPLSSDAVTLSKQGDVGDRLIPKLRAVDTGVDGFEANTFEAQADGEVDSDDAEAETTEQPAEQAPLDTQAEFERRREIDQRAISSFDDEDDDSMAQTADLLDALRRRRGERERDLLADQAADGADEADRAADSDTDAAASADDSDAQAGSETAEEPLRVAGITPDEAAKPEPDTAPEPAEVSNAPAKPKRPVSGPDLWAAVSASELSKDRGKKRKEAQRAKAEAAPAPTANEGGKSKRRTSIPSWDDILFGTRGDDEQS